MANRLNRLGNRSTGFPCPVEVRSREAQKSSLSPSSLLFPVEPHPLSGRGPVEVRSRQRASFFTGTDYPYWKARMTWFLQSTDLDVWDVIEDGPTFPTKLVDGVLVPKPKKEWNELDRRNFQLNAKAVFTLQCAMDRNEYNRICQCDEDIEVSTLKWHTKVTAIQEAKDLTKLPMEELLGSLMTYEISLTKQLQESEDKKKKSIALKATTKEEEDVEEEKPSEEDDDLALITRKLNKYMRGERFRGKKFTSRRNPSRRESSSHGDKEKWEEKGDLICFKCKKPGHIKYDCPLYKIEAKRRMKKAMMATWSESEESSEEEKEKEVANMCFMAIDDLDEGSKEDKWFLDSGCSRHMTGDESKFAFLTKRKGGYVTFGDNAKGRIIGQGLETSMGKLQIEDKRQQEESGEDPKKEDSPLALPPPQQVQGESSQDLPKDWKFVINHPQDQIIGNPSSGVRTRSSLRNICNNLAFISQIEPKNIKDAIVDEDWMIAMQEELNQFERSEVWELVPRPSNQSVIGTKWVFRNKMDENGIIVRNKARLVAQGYNQEEGIDYEETFAP
ncbi:putative mitochondrial protein [Vitis vinifera]|uniref:Putative mitochondrial protein n=1 Tax=Vitis vinifera TaxID=29760 RepID=A0A438FS91_VITVI|nr:putative mitochondrial protein [Vitis vinifera]